MPYQTEEQKISKPLDGLLWDPINAFIAMDKDSSGSLTLEAPPRSIQALACTRPRSHPALIFTGRAPALMCRSCGPS